MVTVETIVPWVFVAVLGALLLLTVILLFIVVICKQKRRKSVRLIMTITSVYYNSG